MPEAPAVSQILLVVEEVVPVLLVQMAVLLAVLVVLALQHPFQAHQHTMLVAAVEVEMDQQHHPEDLVVALLVLLLLTPLAMLLLLHKVLVAVAAVYKLMDIVLLVVQVLSSLKSQRPQALLPYTQVQERS
jgi:hypothetical protein